MRLVLFSVLISSLGFAQSFQGTLRGRLLDPNGATTAAAAITLTDEGTLIARSTVTNDQGRIHFRFTEAFDLYRKR